jgi:hypothetical protein
MRNENMVDTAAPDLVARQLHLRSFATVYKKLKLVKGYYLRRRMPVVRRQRRIISKYGYSKHVAPEIDVFSKILCIDQIDG